jgi:exopolysaccharide biosynthesis predicted pyruvyltransferase EpsI
MSIEYQHDAQAGIRRLRELLTEPVAALVPPASRYALLGFPHHSNAGDSAIWCATRSLLRQVTGCDPTLSSSPAGFRVKWLSSHLDGQVIVLQGGGNFGDVWPWEHEYREAVLRKCGGQRVVQMPQSIHFDSMARLHATRDVIKQHGGFTLLVRDTESFDIASNELQCDVRLVPDIVFALDVPPPEDPPAQRRLWLLREDRETTRDSASMPADHTDWHDPANDPALKRLDGLERMAHYLPWLVTRRSSVEACDAAAGRRLSHALQLLSRGTVVVTNRLHGHILCTLLGRRHVVLDTKQRKISNFMKTWNTAYPELCRVAGSYAEAEQMADELERAS